MNDDNGKRLKFTSLKKARKFMKNHKLKAREYVYVKGETRINVTTDAGEPRTLRVCEG